MRFAFLVAACLACAACSRPIERGEALYQDGRYVEAAEMFELTEPRLSSMSAEACAAFGLYRGLTYLRLEDLASARKWLAYAYSVERKSPGMLLPEQRHLLDRGWAELEGKTAPPGATPALGERKIAAAAPPQVEPPVPETPREAPSAATPGPAVQR